MRTFAFAGLGVFLILGALALVRPAKPAAAGPAGKRDISPPIDLALALTNPDGDNLWEGLITSDLNGAIAASLDLSAYHITGEVDRVTFIYDFIDGDLSDGDQSFTAALEGTVNWTTGVMTMDGTTTAGYLSGAPVRVEGWLVDPDTWQFKGRMVILPAG